MRAIYRVKWDDQFATEQDIQFTLNEWSEGLYGLEADQIKRGIEGCRRNLKWPPSIAEFREQCTGITDDWEHQGDAYKVLPKCLPKPKNVEVGLSALEEIKRKLK